MGKFTNTGRYAKRFAPLVAPANAAKQLNLFASSQESMEPSWELVDLKNLTVERAREFETVFLALAL